MEEMATVEYIIKNKDKTYRASNKAINGDGSITEVKLQALSSSSL